MILGFHHSYPLVMTNSSPWKDPPFLRTVNHLFLWAIEKPGYVSHNQMVNPPHVFWSVMTLRSCGERIDPGGIVALGTCLHHLAPGWDLQISMSIESENLEDKSLKFLLHFLYFFLSVHWTWPSESKSVAWPPGLPARKRPFRSPMTGAHSHPRNEASW